MYRSRYVILALVFASALLFWRAHPLSDSSGSDRAVGPVLTGSGGSHHPGHHPHSADPGSPEGPVVIPDQPKEAVPGMPQTGPPPRAAHGPAAGLLGNASELDTHITIEGGRRVSRTLYETDFKYPYVLVTKRHAGVDPDAPVETHSYQVADHILVRFVGEDGENRLRAWANAHGAVFRRKMHTEGHYIIAATKPSLSAAADLTQQFRETFEVESGDTRPVVEGDFLYFSSTIPNDPALDDLWGLNNTGQTNGIAGADIDADKVWTRSIGSRDVLVGILDSGFYRHHEDLGGNAWANPGEIPGNGVDDDNNGFIDDVHGWDFYADDNDPSDDEDGHGTHVSGTIGAVGNNGIGITGVNQEVSLVGIRILGPNNGASSASDIIDAVHYSIAIGAHVTNNSYGGPDYSSLFRDAIAAAGEANQLFVAGCGNTSASLETSPAYPAAYDNPNILSVAATEYNDALITMENTEGFWGSNYGTTSVDLAAPGLRILSTYKNNTYRFMQGTSMASPHAAGAAALILSISGVDTPYQNLKAAMMETVDRHPTLANRIATGGRLNAWKAMNHPAISPLAIPSFGFDDSTSGNGDGYASAGEAIQLWLEFINQQDAAETGAYLIAESLDPEVAIVTQGRLDLPTLNPAVAHTAATPVELAVAPAAAAPDVIAIRVSIFNSDDTLLRNETYRFPVHNMTSFSGQVVDGVSAAPVNGARVRLAGANNFSRTTGTDGRYNLSVPEGDYLFTVSKDGYTDHSDTVSFPPYSHVQTIQLGRAHLVLNSLALEWNANAGELFQQTLEITNPGNIDLEWTLEAQRNFATPTSPGGDPVWLAGEASATMESAPGIAPIPALAGSASELDGIRFLFVGGRNRSLIRQDLIDRGASVETLDAYFINDSINRFDVLIVDDSLQYTFEPDLAIIRQWLESGGAILIEGGSYFGVNELNSLITGSEIHFEDFGNWGAFHNATYGNFREHPTTEGIAPYGPQIINSTINTSDPGKILATSNVNGNIVFAAIDNVGQGKAFLVCDSISSDERINEHDSRLFTNQILDYLALEKRWLKLQSETGTTAPQATSQITLMIDASELNDGLYETTIRLTSNDPDNPEVIIPVSLNVSGAPRIDLTPESVDFERVWIGETESHDLVITNAGAKDLVITEATPSNPAFSIDMATPQTIAPGASRQASVSFNPDAVTDYSGVLEFSSNDPVDPVFSLNLTGRGVLPPEWELSTSVVDIELPLGSSNTTQLSLRNLTGAELHWHLSGTNSIDHTLENAVSLLDGRHQQITGLIPNLFEFTDGISGNKMIGRGKIETASIMYSTYSGGNFLSFGGGYQTNTFLNYSDGVVATHDSLGANGAYITRKFPGLFVLIADLDKTTSFEITGRYIYEVNINMVSLTGAVLRRTYGNREYMGFVKRISGDPSPSVNHLIIVESDDGISHDINYAQSDPFSALDEDHYIKKIPAGSRIHYLLFASKNGGFISNEVMAEIMDAYLNITPWLATDASSGTIDGADSTSITLTVDSQFIHGTTGTDTLTFVSNDPLHPLIEVPVSYSVIDVNDDDGDSINDAWEEAHFGASSAINGSIDSDGDAVYDFFEYLLGSHPLDSTSREFIFSGNWNDAQSEVVFEWVTIRDVVFGHNYLLELSSDLNHWKPHTEHTYHYQKFDLEDGRKRNVLRFKPDDKLRAFGRLQQRVHGP